MERQRGDRRGVLQKGGREGSLLAIPDTRSLSGSQGTVAPVGAEQHPGEPPREREALQNLTAGEAANHDLAVRRTDGQALPPGVPGGRAHDEGTPGKGEGGLPLQVPEPAVRLFGCRMKTVR